MGCHRPCRAFFSSILLVAMVCTSLINVSRAAPPSDAGQPAVDNDTASMLAKLQTEIAKDRRLDGILVDSATYDAVKKTLTVGGRRWESPQEIEQSQLDALRELILDYCKNQWPRMQAAEDIATNPIRPIPNLAVSLKNAISQQTDLDGVRIDRHFYDNGKLHFEGLRANAAQQQQTRELIVRHLQPTAEWQKWVGDDNWELGDLRLVPLHEFLRQSQEIVASNNAFDGIRLDRAHFDPSGRLTLSGIDWPADDVAKSVGTEDKSSAGRADTLQWQLMRLVASDWPDFVDGGQLRLEFNAVNSPLHLIRGLVSQQRSWDGMRIDRAYYVVGKSSEHEWSPKLMLTGIQPVLNVPTVLQQIDTATPAPTKVWDPVCCREVLVPAGKQQPSAPKTTPVAVKLDEALLKLIEPQIRLMADGHTILNGGLAVKLQDVNWADLRVQLQDAIRHAGRTGAIESSRRLTLKARIDRLYFDDSNSLHLEGVFWPERNGEGGRIAELRDVLVTELNRSPPAYEGTINSRSPAFDDLPQLPSALMELREIVARDQHLDGLRIDNAHYDGQGKLQIEVAQANDRQLKRLHDLLHSQAGLAHWTAWTTKGWEMSSQKSSNFGELRHTVMNALAMIPALDGVRVDRAYYDSDLRLKFEGQNWNPNQNAIFVDALSTVIQSQFSESVRNFDGSRTRFDDPAIASQLSPRVNLDSLRTEDDLLTRIRKRVSDDGDFDGVRVDRAFFSADSTLQFRGLFATEEQRKRLQACLKRQLLPDDDSSRQLPHGFSLTDMQVVPMNPLLNLVQDVVAGHSKLDGVKVIRANYSPDGRLTVHGRVHNATQKRLLADVLNSQMPESHDWQPRIFGSQVTTAHAQPLNVEPFRVAAFEDDQLLSNRFFNTGYRLFWDSCYPEAAEKFTDAILHQPQNVQARYYRALTYMLMDKFALARRDIRRSLEIENATGRKFHNSQYRKIIERVRGPERRCFEALMLEVQNSPDDPSLVNAVSSTDGCKKCEKCREPCCKSTGTQAKPNPPVPPAACICEPVMPLCPAPY